MNLQKAKTVSADNPLILALPKGRILKEVRPLLDAVGIEPEAAFDDSSARQLTFNTNHPGVKIIRVRSFDVATFVAFAGAHMGICGNDVLLEFGYDEIYAPLDLDIGHCRMSIALPVVLSTSADPTKLSHVRVATKYPAITSRYFADRGVQAECIKLNGAMELAPTLGLCRRIVDLVSTGDTLRANRLVEVEQIMDITSRFIVNRGAFKTRPTEVSAWIGKFEEAMNANAA